MPTITEAKRETPVRKKADVLVVGGVTAGVTTKNGGILRVGDRSTQTSC